MAKLKFHLHDEFEREEAGEAKRSPSVVQIYRQKRSEGRWRLIVAGVSLMFVFGYGATYLLAHCIRLLPWIRVLPMLLRC